MVRLRFALIAGVFGLVAGAGASTRRHDITDSSYVAAGAAFAAVDRVDGQWISCTLIAPGWVLTAAHTGVNGRGRVFMGGREIATDWIVHPGWDGDVTHGNDYALGRLVSNVTNVAPIRYTAANVRGMVATSVGFGLTGTGATGQQAGTEGVRRAFTNVIDARDITINGQLLKGYVADFDQIGGGSNTMSTVGRISSGTSPTAREGAAAHQDSGGGMFVTLNGETVLAGVTSYVVGQNGATDPIGKYGDWTVWAPTDSAAAWIEQTSGVAPVPEPSVLVALLVGGGVLRSRRRRAAR